MHIKVNVNKIARFATTYRSILLILTNSGKFSIVIIIRSIYKYIYTNAQVI